MTCRHAASGCNYPEGDCQGACAPGLDHQPAQAPAERPTRCCRQPAWPSCAGMFWSEYERRQGGGMFGSGGTVVERGARWICPQGFPPCSWR